MTATSTSAEISLSTASDSTAADTTTATVSTLLISIRELQEDIAHKEALIKEHKAIIAELHDAGLIPDAISFGNISAALVSRKTWEHSPALVEKIKHLKEMEIDDGSATQKVTTSWTVRLKAPQG
jgi:hypothetical protein